MSVARTAPALLITLLLVPTAFAATVTWSVDDPASGTIPVDLGVTLVNVTEVSILATGYGGGQHGWCEMMDEPWGYDFWLEFTVDLSLDGAGGSFTAPLQQPYGETVTLTNGGDPSGWAFLEDGRADLTIGYHHNFSFDMIHCLPMGYEALTIDQLVLTVTCETAVPNETMSFGTVKALYR